MVYVKIRNSPYECLRQMSKFDHQETIENEEEEEGKYQNCEIVEAGIK